MYIGVGINDLVQEKSPQGLSRALSLYYSLKGGDPAARSRTATLLRLSPSHPPYLGPSRGETSGIVDFHGLTGGVYKTRERIHRSVLICDY